MQLVSPRSSDHSVVSLADACNGCRIAMPNGRFLAATLASGSDTN